MAESAMTAQHAHTAGWSARFSEAAPGAILAAVLGAVLVALVGLIAWIAVSVVNLQTQAGKLEEGLQQTNERLTRLERRVEEGFEKTDERLTRLEDRVVDIYKLLAERLPPPQEKSSRQR